MSFFYSFIGMLLHSIWQAGLLTLVYISVQALVTNIHPLQRRNLLYSLLSAQVVVSLFTFFIYFTQQKFALITGTNGFSLNWLSKYVNTIFVFYCLVVFYKFLSVIFQWNVFIKNYQKSLLKASSELKIFTELKAYQLGIKRKVTVWYCKNIESPITFGFLKPMILLPFSLVNTMSMQEVETIILHELAHIKSKDYLLNWLLLGMEIVYFFNPFALSLTNKIKLEREKNCDTQVLDFNYNEILYAQTLLKIAQNTVAVQSFQLGAVKQTSQLLQRIHFFSTIENYNLKPYKLNILGWMFIPVLLFTTTLFLQKNKIVNITTLQYSKILVAQIYQPKRIVSYSEVAQVMNIVSSKNAKKEQSNFAKVKAKKVRTIDLTFKESAIEMENILPVSYNETADSVKEFLYNIETQQGKMTQSYKLIQRNGRWILEPQWMIVERNADSISYPLNTDTIFNRVDSIQ
jgi:beta-lactamase regulating signal transducer with metallopeptidase domain